MREDPPPSDARQDPGFTSLPNRWRIVIAVSTVVAIASKCWIQILDRSPCGLYSSVVDSRLTNSLVLASHMTAIALAVTACRGITWEGVRYATTKRAGLILLASVVAATGLHSWGLMTYRCHGS